MKKIILVLIALCMVLGVAGHALAAVPEGIAYEGRLTDLLGTPETGNHSFRFSIVNGSDSLIWGPWPSASGTPLTLSDQGVFSTIVGDGSLSLTSTVFSSNDRYLKVEVQNGIVWEDFSPRTRIVSTGYTFHAASAESATLAYSIAPGIAVTSISSAGATPMTGTVTIAAGSNVTISQASNTILISSTGGGNAAYAALSGTATNAVHAYDLSITAEANGDLLYFNGSNWVRLPASTNGYVLKTNGAGAAPSWMNPTSGGTVTSIEAGFGLKSSPNPITTSGMISVDSAALVTGIASDGATFLTGNVTVAAGSGIQVTQDNANKKITISSLASGGSVPYATLAGSASSAAYSELSGTASSTAYAGVAGNASSAATATYAGLSGTASSTVYSQLSGTASSTVYSELAGSASSAAYSTLAGSASSAAYAGLAGSASSSAYSGLAGSASSAATATYAGLSGTASSTVYSQLSGTASSTVYSELAGSASSAAYSTLAGSASSAAYSGLAGSASSAATATYAGLSGTASSTVYSQLSGTASTVAYATLAGSASSAAYAGLAGNASSAATATYAGLSGTASSTVYSQLSGTASTVAYATLAGSASSAAYSTLAGSASSAAYAGLAGNASSAATATYAGLAGSASSAAYSGLAGSASSAAYSTLAGSASSVAYSTLAGSASSAAYAGLAGSASSAAYAGLAGNASSAAIATYAGLAGNASSAAYSGLAGNASSAAYSTLAGSASSAAYAGLAGSASSAAYAGLAGNASSAAIATYAGLAGNASSAAYSGLAGSASSAAYAGLAGTASNAALSVFNVPSGETITGLATFDGTAYFKSGTNQYLSYDSNTGAGAMVIRFNASNTITAGDVVVVDDGAIDSVKVVDGVKDRGAIGFAVTGATAGNPVYVAINGRVINAKAGTGGVNRGDAVATSDYGSGGYVETVSRNTVGAQIGIALNNVAEGGTTLRVLITKF